MGYDDTPGELSPDRIDEGADVGLRHECETCGWIDDDEDIDRDAANPACPECGAVLTLTGFGGESELVWSPEMEEEYSGP